MNINKETKLFISVAQKPGNFGASVYNKLFAAKGINAVYLPRKAPESAEELISAIRSLGISGCSVSMPLKSKVVPHLDTLDEAAKQTQSVNTKVNVEGQLTGYNTDVVGIREALRVLTPKSALVYGSGSVVNSIVYVLQQMKLEKISLAARNSDKATAIANIWGITSSSVEAMKDSAEEFDLLVNGTPASVESPPHELYDLLPLGKAAFDVVASNSQTPWLQAAMESGLETISGLTMYQHQIQRQFEIYTGKGISLSKITSSLP